MVKVCFCSQVHIHPFYFVLVITFPSCRCVTIYCIVFILT
ncbi:hypothetical protein EUBVEN_01943 [Eubacterium ventriosum ATCC 27560]|uniref:Uncharacterized protein n=1 Tax=Eubacterium ventriosum ATCC 27560 TaxID=411463 RepID=A5Z8A2_9FIRM|nr:hypothetical protein EUBVEN_01943 [Eubacterium ventriosum ATCC 27560]